MSDHSLILGLESRLVNAWPSFDYQAYDGWILRLAAGYTKRANSATPLLPGASLDEPLLVYMVERFIAANVRPTFRLNGLEGAGVDALLAARGFREIEPTCVLSAPVDGDCEVDSEVAIEAKVSKQWVREASESYGGEKDDEAALLGIVSRIRQKAAFATLRLDERPVAWGLGVVERGYVGLYDIVVAPDLRGIGLGRRVVLSLMAWGCTHGAHTAYLQVREENEIARSLYGALGFRLAYRYTHRVMPAPASP
ncbi:GNAT family N-acetyltransferase [Microvirga lenta]|uniref:GNAT family N-acetyltransferase n=1 Tax=Microvirga lenta TaxID=2881337 RepID=UPI001CFE5DCD|nr:GNAT family N-acetyltransferase [Microvirga lenta]MCB5174323.1 GNAT family N-acetyltransferase [Microvirga lenta]